MKDPSSDDSRDLRIPFIVFFFTPLSGGSTVYRNDDETELDNNEMDFLRSISG